MMTLLVARLALTSTAFAQDPGAPAGGQRRFQPLPDHWLTLDSVVQQVGVTAAQRQAVTQNYNAISGVLKEAAQVRDSMRQAFQQSGGASGERPSREAMQPFMERFQAMQAEVDTYYAALRGLLTPEQQARLDSLPKPLAFRRMQRPPQ